MHTTACALILAAGHVSLTRLARNAPRLHDLRDGVKPPAGPEIVRHDGVMGEPLRMHSRDLATVEQVWQDFVPTARLLGADPSSFRFDWTSVQSPGFASIEYELTARVRSAVAPADQLFVCQVTAAELSLGTRREAFDPTAPWLAPQDVTMAQWDGHARVRAFVFDLREAEAAARVMTGDDRLRLRVTDAQPLDGAAGRGWTAAFDHTHALLIDDAVRENRLLEAELRRHALRVTLASFSTTMLDAITDPAQRRAGPTVVRLAKAFMDEHAQDAITVEDVARAAHISTRGLQYAFMRATGETPMRYLRRARLSGAHGDLLRGEDPVATVARRWGFANPSRFAEHYRAEFGRLPREAVRIRRELAE